MSEGKSWRCAIPTKQVQGGKKPAEVGLAELTVFRVQLSVWKVLCCER